MYFCDEAYGAVWWGFG